MKIVSKLNEIENAFKKHRAGRKKRSIRYPAELKKLIVGASSCGESKSNIAHASGLAENTVYVWIRVERKKRTGHQEKRAVLLKIDQSSEAPHERKEDPSGSTARILFPSGVSITLDPKDLTSSLLDRLIDGGAHQ